MPDGAYNYHFLYVKGVILTGFGQKMKREAGGLGDNLCEDLYLHFADTDLHNRFFQIHSFGHRFI